MNTYKSIATRFVFSAIVATTVGLCSSVTLAETKSYFQTRSVELIDLHLAYNASRWPVYRNVHQKKKRDKADSAGFDKKSAAASDRQHAKKQLRGQHRRAPHSN